MNIETFSPPTSLASSSHTNAGSAATNGTLRFASHRNGIAPGKNFTAEDIRAAQVFQELDRDQSGRISYSEFVDSLERAEEEHEGPNKINPKGRSYRHSIREAADFAATAASKASSDFGLVPADAAALGGRAAGKLATDTADRVQAADAAAEAAGTFATRVAIDAGLTLEQVAEEATIAACAAAEEAGSTPQHVAEVSAKAAGIAAGEMAADAGNTAMKSAEIAAKAATKSAATSGLPPYQAVEATATAAARSASRAAINAGHPYLIIAEVTRQLNTQLVAALKDADNGKDSVSLAELKEIFSRSNIDIHEDASPACTLGIWCFVLQWHEVFEEMGVNPSSLISFRSFMDAVEKAHGIFMEAGRAAATVAGRVIGQAAAESGDDPEQAGEVAASAASSAAKTAGDVRGWRGGTTSGLAPPQVAEVAVAAAGNAAASAAIAAGSTPEQVAFMSGQAAVSAARKEDLEATAQPQVVLPIFARAAGRAAAQQPGAGRDTAKVMNRAAGAASEDSRAGPDDHAGERLGIFTTQQLAEAAEAASNEASRVLSSGPRPAAAGARKAPPYKTRAMAWLSIWLLLGSVWQPSAEDCVVTVDPTQHGVAQGRLVGAGIEDVNNELYGGLYTEMVYGDSFEEPPSEGVSGADFVQPIPAFSGRGLTRPTWKRWAASESSHFNVSFDRFHGNQSQLIQNGAIANFGLGQQGMHFVADKDYHGFLYAKADGPATLNVSLVAEENGRRQLLNTTTFQLKSSNAWVRLDFVLTPAASTFCGMAFPNSSFVPRAKLCGYSTPIPEVQSGCYQCTGGISLDVRGAPVRIDSVSLQPGSWGCFRGLPVRKDVAEAMFNIAGWGLLRLGGTMCNAAGYSWKNFRGTRRDAYRGFWHPVASSSFRILEVLQLCEVAEVQCAITLNSNEDPTDMADFVEYCYGPPSSTWGSMRTLDGRQEAYKPFVIEIGNEQPLSMEFVKKVESITAAMRQRAKDLLLPFPLRIAVGQNIDLTPNFDTAEGRSLTTKMLDILKPFGAAAAWDAHIGGDSFSDVDDFRALLRTSSEFFRRAGATKLVAFEENGNTHDLQRALVHARFNIMSSYHGDSAFEESASADLVHNHTTWSRWFRHQA
eukprot:s926_g5.t3